ncbi:NAD(P)H-dependent oxidoreductase [Nonomuraea sp. NPDC049421]|uniref:NAD(P)H-dependent oxidoreductase n=1 Tax=Nonomuraea sp. NPDC049421 TaxID=3155275 RepID=UPI00342B4F6A
MTLRVAVVNGSPNEPSKTMGLVDVILATLDGMMPIEVARIDVYRLGPGFTGAVERDDVTPEVESALRLAESADLLVAAAPGRRLRRHAPPQPARPRTRRARPGGRGGPAATPRDESGTLLTAPPELSKEITLSMQGYPRPRTGDPAAWTSPPAGAGRPSSCSSSSPASPCRRG